MTIKKRTTTPDPETSASTASYPDEDFRVQGRAAALQGLRYDVYLFIGNNPKCTRRDVAQGLKLPNNVATARIKELIDEGFVHEPVGIRKLNPSGVNARVLEVTDQKAGALPLDRVRVEVELAIDYNGNYYVSLASVVGSHVRATTDMDPPKGYRYVKTQRFTMTAPRIDPPAKPMYDLDEPKPRVTRMTRADLTDTQGEIIDIDAVSTDD